MRDLATQLQSKKDAQIGRLDEERQALLEAAGDNTERVRELERYYQSKTRDIEAVHVIASATERALALTHSGEPAAVFADMDNRSLTKLTIETEGRYSAGYWAEVTMRQPEGVEIVVGGDPEWVRSTFSTLVAVVKRDRPWWWTVRWGVGATLFTVVSLYLLISVWPGPLADPDPDATPIEVLLPLVLGLCGQPATG
ncbi:MAG: hypothetical protein IH818_14485 [Acidobacteria bacterium]|nr:hypothetical protein [Acidobacteriota bacterium]